MHNQPFTVQKPWGEFRQYTLEEPVTVKTLFVKKGEELSLQYHHDRKEFWRILSGNPRVTIGDQIIEAKPGDEFSADVGVKHRIDAPYDDVLFLEIAYGTFKEDDIVRLEDNYGRA